MPSSMRTLQLLGDPPRPTAPLRLPLFAKGFRPFFLLGATFAAAMVPLWILALFGLVSIGGRLDPVTWHAHEMVFGFGAAIIGGFLLTAVGNWTGRETAIGVPLLLLTASWLAGRAVMTAGAAVPAWLVAAIDVSFLPGVAMAIGRPIVAARDRRHYPIIAMLVVMAGANLCLHVHPATDARRGLPGRAHLLTSRFVPPVSVCSHFVGST